MIELGNINMWMLTCVCGGNMGMIKIVWRTLTYYSLNGNIYGDATITFNSPASLLFKLPQQMRCVEATVAEGGREGEGEQHM